ncbi:hypothetical protein DRJ54_06290 [Candidatus Acetothermia bacterium]|nr:MAG: hypothetical protein DRJ54_06290 [Candidatus Acetothermia bacterium]
MKQYRTRWAKDIGLRSRGGRVLGKSEIHRILTNPVYYGDFRWNGALYRGTHKPIVSRALFEAVQTRLHGRTPARRSRRFPFRGLLQCGYCGCKITASLEKGKYIYYHCTHGKGRCEQGYVRQETLSDRLASVVEAVSLTKEDVEYLLSLVRRRHGQRYRQTIEWRQKLLARKEQLENLLKKAYEDKLEGRISEERWQRYDSEWSRELAVIEEELDKLERKPVPRWDDLDATFELLQMAPDLYRRQSDEERARLLNILVSNLILKGENAVPIYKKPFNYVVIGRETGNWLGERDSNPH